MAKQALGKGLGALIRRSGADPSAPHDGDLVEKVPLARVMPSALQPRKHFPEEALAELLESIRQHGIIQPLIVREKDEKLEIIAGERRFRAAEALGMTEVPVICRVASDQDVLEMALIENLQREDLDPIEEARGYERLAREFGLRQEDIASRMGKNRATVANAIRLLDLPEPVQAFLSKSLISTGHAKAILSLKDDVKQAAVAETVIRRKMTVRETEALVNQELEGSGQKPARRAGGREKKALPPHLASLEKSLRSHLATHVTLTQGAKKGRVEIEFYGDDDLQRLVELLGVVSDD